MSRGEDATAAVRWLRATDPDVDPDDYDEDEDDEDPDAEDDEDEDEGEEGRKWYVQALADAAQGMQRGA